MVWFWKPDRLFVGVGHHAARLVLVEVRRVEDVVCLRSWVWGTDVLRLEGREEGGVGGEHDGGVHDARLEDVGHEIHVLPWPGWAAPSSLRSGAGHAQT